MRGIQVRFQRAGSRGGTNSPLPHGVSSFAFFFEPILPHLAEFTWIYDPGDGLPFSASALLEPDYDDETDRLPGGGIIPANTLLPKFANFVKNDWLDIFGFRTWTEDPAVFLSGLLQAERKDQPVRERLVKGCKGPDEWSRAYVRWREHVKQNSTAANRYLAANVDICFLNVDGAYWEMYSRESQLLESVRKHLGTVAGITWDERSLLERDL